MPMLVWLGVNPNCRVTFFKKYHDHEDSDDSEITINLNKGRNIDSKQNNSNSLKPRSVNCFYAKRNGDNNNYFDFECGLSEEQIAEISAEANKVVQLLTSKPIIQPSMSERCYSEQKTKETPTECKLLRDLESRASVPKVISRSKSFGPATLPKPLLPRTVAGVPVINVQTSIRKRPGIEPVRVMHKDFEEKRQQPSAIKENLCLTPSSRIPCIRSKSASPSRNKPKFGYSKR